jgi:uncharacterized phage protein (TIGR02218 family)
MRTFVTELDALLKSNVLTLAHAIKITTKLVSSPILYFTDHFENLTIEGFIYITIAFELSALNYYTDGSSDPAEIVIPLQDAGLEIQAGYWDNADYELYLVDYTDTDNRYILRKGKVGKIPTDSTVFTLELAEETSPQQSFGMVFSSSCQVRFGSALCGVDVASLEVESEITEVLSNRSFIAESLDSYADGYFNNGQVTFTLYTNTNLIFDVKQYKALNSEVVLVQTPPFPLIATTTFTITPGCDKSKTTCAEFNNTLRNRAYGEFIPAQFRLDELKKKWSSAI